MSPRPSGDVETADLDKSYVDNVEIVANANKPNPRKEAPVYVAGLTPEEREKAEKALVRKIDIRLLPMLIIMYILNYLDRNNIVSKALIVFSDQKLISLGCCPLGRTRIRPRIAWQSIRGECISNFGNFPILIQHRRALAFCLLVIF